LTQDTPGVDGTPEAGDAFGAALAAGDFNADGSMDLAIGAPGEDIGGGGAGMGLVHVLLGTSEGLTGTGDQVWHQDSDGIGETAEAGDRFGAALASGDLDGDGIPDLVIGVHGEDLGAVVDAGLVHALYGTNSGLTSAGSQIWSQGTTGIEDDPETEDAFGFSVAVGDFNGDGFGDAAIGVPLEDVETFGNAGAVNVLFGSDGTGLVAADDLFLHQNTPGVEGSAEPGDLFGFALAGDDFDGDGTFGDLVVGAPGEAIGKKKNAGAVNVLYGTAAGPGTSNDQLWHQNVTGIRGASEAGDKFGEAVGSGDFNDDGRADLVVGVPSEDLGSEDVNAGAATVINGGASGLTASADKTWHQDVNAVAGAAERGDAFGSSVG
jgi:hypothetical protein